MLDQLIDLMSCPKCASNLDHKGDQILCSACGAEFPIHDNMPLMAVHGTAETWQAEPQADSSSDYQRQYQDLDAAARYNRSYRDKLTKRWSTNRELGLLARMQSGQPKCRTLLNIPSGGGRLSDTIAVRTELLIEADIAIGQLRYARQQNGNKTDRIWMTASGFHIPFKNNSIDGVICCRLCHHLPTATERERLLAELLRVARRYVIMTFFDFHSPKNYLRRARRPVNRKAPKLTMTRNQVAELAQRHGAELVAEPALAYLFSGHHYALMVKREPTGPAC